MSAEIIQFIPCSRHERTAPDFPAIAFRSAPRPDDLTMDHVDTSPSEYWPCEYCAQTEKENEPHHRTFP
jgi:hypothetical protein